jgi:flagellar protein FlaG
MEINGMPSKTASAGYDIQPIPVYAIQQPNKAVPMPSEAKEQHVEDVEQMRGMVHDIQENLSNLAVSLQFSIYGKHNNKISIVVTEKETGKIIREIPSKELQALSAKMSEVVGLIFNKTA